MGQKRIWAKALTRITQIYTRKALIYVMILLINYCFSMTYRRNTVGGVFHRS